MNLTILLDTNAYTGFKAGREELVQELQAAKTIVLTPVVLGELYAGFRLGARESTNLAELESFRESPRVSVVGISERTAFFYGQVFAGLRAKARPIPTNDMWIAATALEHGLVVVSRDSHFREIDGLACRLY